MKLKLSNLFNLHNKRKTSEKKHNDSKNVSKGSNQQSQKYSNIDYLANPGKYVKATHPSCLNHTSQSNSSFKINKSLRKSKSFNDLKINIVGSLRRSSSSKKRFRDDNHIQLEKVHEQPNIRSLKSKRSLPTLKERSIFDFTKLLLYTPNLEEKCSIYSFNNDYNLNNTEPTIHDTTNYTSDETYTSMFNSLYADYDSTNDSDNSDSIQSSFISNKENKTPQKYLLESSNLPNYNILSSQTLPSFPSFTNQANPFSEIDNYNYLPHEKLLLRASQIHGLSPTDSLSNAIKKHRESLYLEPTKSNEKYTGADIDDEMLNIFSNSNMILPSPKSQKPLTPLPPLPPISALPSPALITPFKSQDGFYYNPNVNNNDKCNNDDIEESSLFDALSNVELWDCSKITLVSYNNT